MTFGEKIYLFLVRYRLIFILNFIYFLKTLVFIFQSKFDILYRDDLQFWWAKTFQSYFDNNKKKETLLKWFDKEDQDLILELLSKIQHIAENNLCNYSKLFTKQDEIKRQEYLKYFYKTIKTSYFKWSSGSLLNEYYIPISIEKLWWLKKYNWKDILDCGAFIGDSAVIFSDIFSKSKIYAFEPNQQNLIKLDETINHFEKKNIIIPANFWLSDQIWEIRMDGFGAGSKIDLNGNGEIIKLTTIDDFVTKKKLNPGMIKMDIEWAEYSAIIWAEKTIKQFKPVLFISIYHTGKDFFEIKPLIESWNLGYKFTIHRRNQISVFADTILVCY